MPQEDDRLIPVFIPPLVDLLRILEGRKGAPLTEAEVIETRDKGVCMMMGAARAVELERARGYRDIDPQNVWEEWCRIRENG